MKDRIFICILILFLFVLYLGNDNIIKRSNEVLLKSKVNTLEIELDSLKRIKNDLYNYSSDLETICEKYKSSRDAKYNYHLKSKIILN